jgi:Zn-finger nucleic acid-binding protein
MAYGSKKILMNCPVCKTPELISTDLESNLTSFRCPECGGNWIRGAEYWRWLERHGPNLPERSDQDSGLSLAEPGKHIDCPECRFRMVKYLVGHGFSFTLDQCGGCKGIWLDRNEWEALKERNLHDDVNAMFTSFWQAEAQRELRRKRLEEIYISRFGAEDYAEVTRIRAWLEAHPKRPELLAYLTDTDPFAV